MMRSTNPRLSTQLYVFFIMLVCLLLAERVWGDGRTQKVNILCGGPHEQNPSIFVQNYVISMENLNQKIRTSSFVVTTTKAQDAPNGHYGFTQCYGYLNTADCTSCFADARLLVTQCYPFTTGRVYLDGCYLRSDNYSFFEEYQRPDDAVECDNTTRMGSNTEASARQAVIRAGAEAPNNGGYAHIELAGAGNDTAYVLADCWKTLNKSSCKACLQNASAVIRGCLPWSEARVLNAGCFMRYSTRDFFNSIPASKRSKGNCIICYLLISSKVDSSEPKQFFKVVLMEHTDPVSLQNIQATVLLWMCVKFCSEHNKNSGFSQRFPAVFGCRSDCRSLYTQAEIHSEEKKRL
ncbi:cysteine-rich receptor-like protein kinase 2 [Tripterygium wilfordii]|uniref:cysteine-rich receptor-like protein kinase 2 n=1 Tax=Tripterygium wilfordii TaxID=458696 RepID=UPI0018F800A5|nr:cysteine-rich receptor-like protein kinase 2 [Tripterygium wilfordii]